MRLLPACHQLLRATVQQADCVVDATAGGGHDTLFLAELVGDSGIVHSFDVQQEALTLTRERLEKAGLLQRVRLHHLSHEHIASVVEHAPSAIMFNLGYLPGSDHHLITQTSSTLRAIESSLRLLKAGGCLSLVAYPGHQGGEEEMLAIEQYFQQLSLPQYSVLSTRCHNGGKKAPCLFLLQKHSE